MSNFSVKNGGFPPINYCPKTKSELATDDKSSKTKERFFSNAPRQNINIRQILSENKKKPIIVIDNNNDNDLEVINSL